MEVDEEAMPESVPDPIAAALVDSPLAAAIAAMLAGTGLVVEELPVLVLEAGAAMEFELDPELLLVTSTPPEVAKTAGAAGLLGDSEGGPLETDVVADAAAGVVLPRVGTDGTAPVAPVLT